MTDSQKIEKLANELVRTERQLKVVVELLNKFVDHDHHNNGLVYKIRHPFNESYETFRVEDFRDKI
jgi:hypothetical protein